MSLLTVGGGLETGKTATGSPSSGPFCQVIAIPKGSKVTDVVLITLDKTAAKQNDDVLVHLECRLTESFATESAV